MMKPKNHICDNCGAPLEVAVGRIAGRTVIVCEFCQSEFVVTQVVGSKDSPKPTIEINRSTQSDTSNERNLRTKTPAKRPPLEMKKPDTDTKGFVFGITALLAIGCGSLLAVAGKTFFWPFAAAFALFSLLLIGHLFAAFAFANNSKRRRKK